MKSQKGGKDAVFGRQIPEFHTVCIVYILHSEYMSGQTSAELSILLDLAELSKRCGLRPSDTDADIEFDPERDDGEAYLLSLNFLPDHDDPNLKRFRQLLDVEHTSHVFAERLSELEDRVERALSLAPRARVR